MSKNQGTIVPERIMEALTTLPAAGRKSGLCSLSAPLTSDMFDSAFTSVELRAVATDRHIKSAWRIGMSQEECGGKHT